MALEKAQPAGIGYVHQMVALMLEGSSLAEGPSSSVLFQRIAEDVCRRSEGATVRGALATWRDVRAYGSPGLAGGRPGQA